MTVGRFLYYIMSPTFCFQLEYPRTQKIRWFWLIKRVFELFILLLLMSYLLAQCIYPILKESPKIILKENASFLDIFDYVCLKADQTLVSDLHLLDRLVHRRLPSFSQYHFRTPSIRR